MTVTMKFKLLLVAHILLSVSCIATVNEKPEVSANKKPQAVRDALPSSTDSSKDAPTPEATTYKPFNRVYRAYPETTYSPVYDHNEYTSPGYVTPPSTGSPSYYQTTTTTTMPPQMFSIQQIMHLLEIIRDSEAFDYLFPSHYYSRSEPSTCGCGEEIQQLQHALLLLQESVRQLRIFVHADELAQYNGNTKKGHYH
ncbi:uncharacterized protein LOC110677012 [Aedes aegypti]|uniref:Uncharacterized protein n=1 Tax=Aedes aegypti TaxID=7159 RepID=A0A6I8TN52_AEDAE|nr:uncharacterized protein LOC110677012 [Aedes aegypti]